MIHRWRLTLLPHSYFENSQICEIVTTEKNMFEILSKNSKCHVDW